MSGLLFIKIHYYKDMKKFLIMSLFLIVSLLPAPLAMADDVDVPATGDLWDNWNTREEGREAKPVSDKDFEKALEQVDKKVNKWKNWANKLKVPRGEEFSQSNETEMIKEEHGADSSLSVLCVPVGLIAQGNVLPIGHYQVKGEKIDGQPVLKFYQAHYEMARFPAVETQDDFGENTISFVKWLPQGDKQIKVIYGSLDMNAYAIIDIEQ